MLGGLYSYFFGPSDDGEYQKAEEKLKLLQTQVRLCRKLMLAASWRSWANNIFYSS